MIRYHVYEMNPPKGRRPAPRRRVAAKNMRRTRLARLSEKKGRYAGTRKGESLFYRAFRPTKKQMKRSGFAKQSTYAKTLRALRRGQRLRSRFLTRRNAPISKRSARSLATVLRSHGYRAPRINPMTRADFIAAKKIRRGSDAIAAEAFKAGMDNSAWFYRGHGQGVRDLAVERRPRGMSEEKAQRFFNKNPKRRTPMASAKQKAFRDFFAARRRAGVSAKEIGRLWRSGHRSNPRGMPLTAKSGRYRPSFKISKIRRTPVKAFKKHLAHAKAVHRRQARSGTKHWAAVPGMRKHRHEVKHNPPRRKHARRARKHVMHRWHHPVSRKRRGHKRRSHAMNPRRGHKKRRSYRRNPGIRDVISALNPFKMSKVKLGLAAIGGAIGTVYGTRVLAGVLPSLSGGIIGLLAQTAVVGGIAALASKFVPGAAAAIGAGGMVVVGASALNMFVPSLAIGTLGSFLPLPAGARLAGLGGFLPTPAGRRLAGFLPTPAGARLAGLGAVQVPRRLGAVQVQNMPARLGAVQIPMFGRR